MIQTIAPSLILSLFKNSSPSWTSLLVQARLFIFSPTVVIWTEPESRQEVPSSACQLLSSHNAEVSAFSLGRGSLGSPLSSRKEYTLTRTNQLGFAFCHLSSPPVSDLSGQGIAIVSCLEEAVSAFLWFRLLSGRRWLAKVALSKLFIVWCYFPLPPVLACGLPWWLSGKESTCQSKRHEFNPWVGKTPWRRKWQPTPVFLPGKSRGQRSLAATVHGVTKSWTWLSD